MPCGKERLQGKGKAREGSVPVMPGLASPRGAQAGTQLKRIRQRDGCAQLTEVYFLALAYLHLQATQRQRKKVGRWQL